MLCMHTLQTYNPKFYLTTTKGIAPHLKRSAYNIDGHSAAILAMDKRFQFLTIQLNLFITTETRVTQIIIHIIIQCFSLLNVIQPLKKSPLLEQIAVEYCLR